MRGARRAAGGAGDVQDAAAELRRALSLHEATFEATADGLLVVDRDGHVVSANRRFLQMLRVSADVLAAGDAERVLSGALGQLVEPETCLGRVRAKRPVAHVAFDVSMEEGRRWYRVRDDGAGFDPGLASRLFQPFQRLHAASEFEGTGIGLATVRRIVERHRGHVRAEGRPGEGATFAFTLWEDEEARPAT